VFTAPIKRGCGYRVAGGIYVEVPLAPPGQGTPLEKFLFCPPVSHVPERNEDGTQKPVPIQQAWGISPRGVTLIQMAGDWHVIDWVGRDSYPNAADILEETRSFGLSRRLELSEEEYSYLGPGSKILLAHAWGSKNNALEYIIRPPEEAKPCPEDREEHRDRSSLMEMCSALHWEGIVGGSMLQADEEARSPRDGHHLDYAEERLRRREVGDTVYYAYAPPEGVSEAENTLALIAAFPIANLAVINHPSAEKEERSIKRATRSGFNVIQRPH
jgi:hypothetical protein